jgi:hypothetical protein
MLYQCSQPSRGVTGGFQVPSSRTVDRRSLLKLLLVDSRQFWRVMILLVDSRCWVECQWTLARSRQSSLRVDALGSERRNLPGVVPRSVWSQDPSYTWHRSAILERGSLLGSVVDSALPSQESLTLGWLWPRSRVGESTCVLRTLNLSSQGVHILPEVRC